MMGKKFAASDFFSESTFDAANIDFERKRARLGPIGSREAESQRGFGGRFPTFIGTRQPLLGRQEHKRRREAFSRSSGRPYS